ESIAECLAVDRVRDRLANAQVKKRTGVGKLRSKLEVQGPQRARRLDHDASRPLLHENLGEIRNGAVGSSMGFTGEQCRDYDVLVRTKPQLNPLYFGGSERIAVEPN